MAIIINKDSRVIIQGITGRVGQNFAERMARHYSNFVGGVTPGKGGQEVFGKPVFNTVSEAMEKTGANTSVVVVGARFVKDSILEAIDAEVPLIICITEGIPVKDMSIVKSRLMQKGCKSRLIGPNCPGIITPGECKIGIMPGYIHKPGNVGVVSRSGTLTYEAVWQLTCLGYGQSTVIGIGGDPINGTSHLDAVKMFNDDPATDAIVMIGEIGGNGEQLAAEWLKANCKKPVAAFIAGRTAPKGRRMGHAGAIVSGNSGSAEDKIKALADANIAIAETPSVIGETLLKHWGKM